MKAERLDRDVFDEIRDINSVYLAELTGASLACPPAPLGLQADVVDQLQDLTPIALDRIARTPVLLACVRVQDTGTPLALNEESFGVEVGRRRLTAFTVLLATWLRQRLAYRNLETRILAGLDKKNAARFCGLTCAEILPMCEQGELVLANRYGADSPFWLRIRRAAERGNPDELEHAWLSAVQLGYSGAQCERADRVTRRRQLQPPGVAGFCG